MNRRQISKYNAYVKLRSVLTENESVFTKFVALKKIQATFENQVDDIETTNIITQDGKGRSSQLKGQNFDLMVQSLVALCKKGLSMAMEQENAALIDFYDVSKSDFYNVPSANVVANARGIIAALKRDVASLADYLVDIKQINIAEILVNNYEQESPMPKLKIKKTAEANKKLVVLFKDTDLTVKKIVNLIEGEYHESNAAFVSMVLSAKAIDDLGGRSTKVIITVTDKAGKPIEGAYADVLELTDEEQYSDEKGELTIEGIKNGTYNLEVTKDELKHSEKFTIKLGEQLRLKVIL